VVVLVFRNEDAVMNIREFLAESDPELLFLSESKYDEAIIGLCESFKGICVAYDLNKIIDILKRDMSHDDALEWYAYNMVGAYMGEHTPVFISRMDDTK
jgi:hypothetical protein